MNYRREIDGLRALAIFPVIFFHAGFETFSGGFVGVDVFFVISGYLITKIIMTQLAQGKFSIINFYERRARRILPALFLVMLVCIPFAWFWLFLSDMKNFSQSLVAVSVFASNILFWRESGYFNPTAELKPLLHTWSLAVEEQFFILYPLLLILLWKLGKRWILVTLVIAFFVSLAFSQWAAYARVSAAFYLLPSRGWELLIGAFTAFYLSKINSKIIGKATSEVGGWLGVALILYAVFGYNEKTPFPGLYALIPTLGTALIILFATHETTVGKFVGNRVFVAIGLISYSTYLWHQPLFAFTKYRSLTQPSYLLFFALTMLALVLAYLSWKYVELPFRDKRYIKRRKIFFAFAILGSLFFVCFGLLGHISGGYKFRFSEIKIPIFSPPIKCHGAVAISGFENPLNECLGTGANGISGDMFLLGDSHAERIAFPLKIIAKEKNTDFFYIYTDNKKDFPHSYFGGGVAEDRIFNHILAVADQGDLVIISFHRGYFNKSRDEHLLLGHEVKNNEKYNFFVHNMERQIKRLESTGIGVILIKDTPLLSYVSSIEKCYYLNIQSQNSSNYCSVTLEQDLHTRKLQSKAFDYLASVFPNTVVVVDPFPILYGAQNFYNPINSDGTYRMFDHHHLTESEALKLIEILRFKIR